MCVASIRKIVACDDLDGLLTVDLFERFARPVVRTVCEAVLEAVPGEASRFGGQPWLPVGADWPTTADGLPLSFVMQVNLSEVTAAAPEGWESPLPRDGWLALFFGVPPAERRGWSDQEVCAVRYTRAGTASGLLAAPSGVVVLPRLAAWDQAMGRMVCTEVRPAMRLHLGPTWTLPGPSADRSYRRALEALGCMDAQEQYDACGEIASELEYDLGKLTVSSMMQEQGLRIQGFHDPDRFFGGPTVLGYLRRQQCSDLQQSVALAARGLDPYRPPPAEAEAAIEADADRWHALFSTNFNLDGGYGEFSYDQTVNWLIHDDDLVAGRFDRVRCWFEYS